MLGLLRSFLPSDGFLPQGHCYLWKAGVLWLHLVSDALITLASFSIPLTLLYFVRRRKDLESNWMFICFAIFIVACGTTRLMEIWTVWNPAYWLSGGIKALAALAAVPTAILLVKLVPDALRLPGPSALRASNNELQREMAERTRAQHGVRRANEDLELRVAERTSQLEAENRRLTQSEERFRTLTESLPHLIWTCGADGRCDYLSRQWLEYTGRPEAEQLGDRLMAQVHPEDLDRVRSEWQKAVARSEAYDTEARIRRADGVFRWFRARANPLRDASGRIVKWIGSSTDVEDAKRSDERLRMQLERLNLLDRTTRALGERQDLRSIFQAVLRSVEHHLPVDFGGFFLYDARQGTLAASCVGTKSKSLATELATPEQTPIDVERNGLSPCVRGNLVCEPDIGGTEFPFLARLMREGLRALVATPLLVQKRTFAIMMVARRDPGSFDSADCEFLRQLSEHVALAANQAQLHGALQRAYDDLRQTQQTLVQQERLRAVGQMASGIAHDINNALSPAALYAQSLLERNTSLDAQARDYLKIITRAVDDVAKTMDRMREFSRAHDAQFALLPIDINRTLAQAIDLTRANWADMPREHGIVIRTECDFASGLPPIAGAEHEIRDALINLILNAVDAMPAGGTLTLRTRMVTRKAIGNLSAPSATVQIEITDTGVGMDERTRKHCIEPFFTTKGDRGTGLGLAMVHGTVERHGGVLQIDSEPGQGTTIRLSFTAAAPAARDDAPIIATSQSAPALRILVVDDDPLVLESLQRVLESDGHRVVAADSGRGGIDLFEAAERRNERFAVVITDLGMPDVDGRQVAAAIKAAAPRTPVILLTGWGQHLLDDHAVIEHVDRIVGKPARLAELRMVLADVTNAAGQNSRA